jgi:Protein of unknown function (DUF4239)
MIDWLYNLPEAAILVLTVVVIVGLMATLPLAVRRIPWMRPSDLNTDFVVRTQATLFTMTSLVLTFTLVQADINFRQADALVTNEASRIDQLDRLLTRYGDADVAKARPLLRAYAMSLVKDEWPVMLRDQRHDNTAQTFAALSRRILAINPANERQNLVLAEMFRTLDTMADVRAQRLSIVTIRLPSLYWWVVMLAVTMLLFVSSSIEQTSFRRTILCAQAAVVGGFLGFVFIMDQPFRGETAIQPDAIVGAIQRIDTRTQ